MFQLQNKAYEIDFARAPQLRLATYFRELLTSDSIRKEIGVFSLAQLFESHYTSIRKGFLKQDYLASPLQPNQIWHTWADFSFC